MTTIDIQEVNFNKKSTSLYDLSILLGVDSFIYCISDSNHQVLALKNYTFDKTVNNFSKLKIPLAEIIKKDSNLQVSYNSVKLALLNKATTLVPQMLYDDKQKASYMDKVTKLKDDQLIKTDQLDRLSANNVYLANRDVTTLLRNTFPNLQIYHAITPLLLGFRQMMSQLTGQNLFGNIRDNLVQLFYFDGHDLVFSNSFEFHSSKDFIYYVMNAYHQFELSPDEIPFYMSGQIVEDSEIYHLLYRYIRNLKKVELPGSLQLGTQMENQEPHFYFDLFSLLTL